MVPLAGIEPALLAELDFESSASTNSATGAFATPAGRRGVVKRAEYSGRGGRVNPLVWKRLSALRCPKRRGECRPARPKHSPVIAPRLDRTVAAGYDA